MCSLSQSSGISTCVWLVVDARLLEVAHYSSGQPPFLFAKLLERLEGSGAVDAIG